MTFRRASLLDSYLCHVTAGYTTHIPLPGRCQGRGTTCPWDRCSLHLSSWCPTWTKAPIWMINYQFTVAPGKVALDIRKAPETYDDRPPGGGVAPSMELGQPLRWLVPVDQLCSRLHSQRYLCAQWNRISQRRNSQENHRTETPSWWLPGLFQDTH